MSVYSDFRNLTDSHGLSPKHLPLSCASQKLPPGKRMEAVGVYYLSCVNFNGLIHFIKIWNTNTEGESRSWVLYHWRVSFDHSTKNRKLVKQWDIQRSSTKLTYKLFITIFCTPRSMKLIATSNGKWSAVKSVFKPTTRLSCTRWPSHEAPTFEKA